MREGAEGASVLGPDFSGSGRGGQLLKESAQVGPRGRGRSGISTTGARREVERHLPNAHSEPQPLFNLFKGLDEETELREDGCG